MNMQKIEIGFQYEVYESSGELSPEDSLLVEAARQATKDAYAPYSRFHVGAVAKLENGEFVRGTNQENASYPAGICAERVLLSAASSLYPNQAIQTLAISYDNKRGPSDHPISPCGICRQSLQEFEQRTGQPVRLILSGQEGRIYVIPRSSFLLPFAFTADKL